MVGQRVIRAIQGAQPTVTFIIANQNSPVPQHVFCDVYTVGDSFSSTPELSNDETQETISKIIQHRVSLTYHGLVTDNVSDAAMHMAAYLDSFQARVKFKEQELSIIRINDIQHSPLLKDVDMYVTCVLDIVVAEERKDSFNIDVIDNVHIDGDLETFEYEHEVRI